METLNTLASAVMRKAFVNLLLLFVGCIHFNTEVYAMESLVSTVVRMGEVAYYMPSDPIVSFPR